MPGKGRPFTSGDPRSGKPAGRQNNVQREVRHLARDLVSNPDYVAALRQCLIDGKAGDLEKTLWVYAYGEPPKYAPSLLDDALGDVLFNGG